MATKWSPKPLTEEAIVRLEGQMPDSCLKEYGTPEHLAVIRYGVEACCTQRKSKAMLPKLAKDGKPELKDGKPVLEEQEVVDFVLDRSKLKSWFEDEAAFLGYASNAKKMLQEHGTLDKTVVKKSRGYE